MLSYSILITAFAVLMLIICVIVAIVRHRSGLKIITLIIIAVLALIGILMSLGILKIDTPPVTTKLSEVVYLQWDPVSEEYLKWTFSPDGQYIHYLQHGGYRVCSYSKEGNDILVNNTRLTYDTYENCYWQTYEKDGQLYKSKIFPQPSESWDANVLYYTYRIDNGTANVTVLAPSTAPSDSYAAEIAQATAAIDQSDYEAAYLLLSTIADKSEAAQALLSKFAFVPLSVTGSYMDNSEKTTYTYTPEGYLSTKSSPSANNQYSAYTHDSDGRVLTEYQEYDHVEYGFRVKENITYCYDENIRLVTKIFGDVSTNYFYDEKGNLIHELTMNSGGYTIETEYIYDEKGNLIQERHTNGSTYLSQIIYGYDSKSNLISRTESGSDYEFRYTYTYDNAGNLQSMQQYDGTTTLNTLYSYDTNNYLVKVEKEYLRILNGEYIIGTNVTVYTYSPEGLLLTDTMTSAGSTRTITYTYDTFGNVTSYVDGSSYIRHDTTITYTYALYYYPQGVPEHIQQILIKKPPL